MDNPNISATGVIAILIANHMRPSKGHSDLQATAAEYVRHYRECVEACDGAPHVDLYKTFSRAIACEMYDLDMSICVPSAHLRGVIQQVFTYLNYRGAV